MDKRNEDKNLASYQDEQYSPGDDLEKTSYRNYPLFKLLVLGITAVFAGSVLLGVLYILVWSPPDFVDRSIALSKHPEIEKLSRAVVEITAAGPGGKRKGTGFNIQQSGLIVTARHLVEGAAYVAISFSDRGTYTTTAWSELFSADAALIDIEAEGLPVIELGAGLPELGEEVIIIGNPLQFSQVVIEGEVLGYRKAAGLAEPLLEVRAPVNPGNSGSPVINRQGQAVGIIFAASQESGGETVGVAVPALALEDNLNKR